MTTRIVLSYLMIMFFVAGYDCAFAQQDYVITTTGDTITGKVRFFNNTQVRNSLAATGRYVQVTPEKGKKSTYEILKVVSFQMNDEIYHTVKFNQGYTFMKLLSSGYLSLYSYQLANQSSWDGRFFRKKDGESLDLPNLGLKKRVANFLSDCSELVAKIESGDFKRTELIKITDEYNACISLKSNLITEKSSFTQSWIELENNVKALPDFSSKRDALEMIHEIQNKVSTSQTIPSFLTNGLKEALKDQKSVKERLDKALEELK